MKISQMIQRTLSVGILAAILTVCTMVANSQGFDWPRWGGPDGNWISQETGWNPLALSDPRVLWKTDVGIGYSNITIKDNRLYTMGLVADDNVVYCLNPDRGKIIWRYSFPASDETQATPTIDEASVYALSKDGLIVCLNAKNGKLRWKKDLVGDCGAVKPYYGFAGPPVIEGDLLILTANTAGMALKRQTGELVWTSDKPSKEAQFEDTNGTDYSMPVIYTDNGKRAALIYSWKGLSSIDVETGETRWLYKWGFGYVQATEPIVLGNQVFLAAEWSPDRVRRSVLLDIQRGSPAVVWKSSDLLIDFATPLIIDGYIYACYGGTYGESPYASLRCLELKTGRLLWENLLWGTKAKGSISLMAADGKLIVLNEKGILYIAEASPSGFTPLSKCDVLKGEATIRRFYTPPVLCKGRIYCRNYAGELICIDVSK